MVFLYSTKCAIYIIGSTQFFVSPEAVLDYVFFQVLPLLRQVQIP